MLPEIFLLFLHEFVESAVVRIPSGSIPPYVCDRDLSAHPFPRTLKN